MDRGVCQATVCGVTMSWTQLSMHTPKVSGNWELVQNVRGPAKDQMGPFWKSKVGVSKADEAITMATGVLGPLRQVLNCMNTVQQFVPVSLASGSPCFCSCGFRGCTGLLGPHLSSSALQLAHSLLSPLHSQGAEVPQKMALRPRGTQVSRVTIKYTCYLIIKNVHFLQWKWIVNHNLDNTSLKPLSTEQPLD